MNKQRITITAFIFKLGDDYLGFLRNLTPTVLFLSLALFGLPELENPNWSLGKVGMVLFSLGSLFIAISAMAVNIASFAKKALKAGVECVVFDRGGFLYHGRVEALADAAREAGLQF